MEPEGKSALHYRTYINTINKRCNAVEYILEKKNQKRKRVMQLVMILMTTLILCAYFLDHQVLSSLIYAISIFCIFLCWRELHYKSERTIELKGKLQKLRSASNVEDIKEANSLYQVRQRVLEMWHVVSRDFHDLYPLYV